MEKVSAEMTKEKLKALMRLKPTLEDTAAFFECTARTIERYIRKEFDLTFVDFREQNMVHTRLTLIRTAIGKAERGDNVMLIFCLKNLCGWKDKWDETQTIVASVSTEPMDEEKHKELVIKARGWK